MPDWTVVAVNYARFVELRFHVEENVGFGID